MNLAPQSTAAFDELIAALTEIRDGYVLSADRFTEEDPTQMTCQVVALDVLRAPAA